MIGRFAIANAFLVFRDRQQRLGETIMKYLMTAIALTALAASPAFAASHKHADRIPAAAANAYASMFDPDAVVEGNRVLGRDPDANVRLQLRQNGWTIDNGGN
jgi:hypothetical protein